MSVFCLCNHLQQPGRGFLHLVKLLLALGGPPVSFYGWLPQPKYFPKIRRRDKTFFSPRNEPELEPEAGAKEAPLPDGLGVFSQQIQAQRISESAHKRHLKRQRLRQRQDR